MELLSIRVSLVFALLFTLSVPAKAFLPLANPMNETIPLTSWSVELEDVVTIPNSSGSTVPRMEFMADGGAPGLAYLVDQRGKIHSFNPTANNPRTTVFMDLSSAVPNFSDGGQQGVRGLAFHPDFNNSDQDGYRKFYTSHSRTFGSNAIGGPRTFADPGFNHHYSVVGEWTVNANGTVNTGSYRELFRVAQPIGDHNIGQIGFNPNVGPGDNDYGNLYVAMGDGGSNAFPQTATDPFNHGQGLDELFGAILRIDPLQDGGDPYGIVADNAFNVNDATTNPQNLIWASGLRNPHRFSFDTEGKGKMLISDIGQGNVEEVNLGFNGANFGWGLREGTFVDTKAPFQSNINRLDPLPVDHPSDAFTYPVAQYDHTNTAVGIGVPAGNGAIAGGVVYRGTAIPQLTGMFLFGDFARNDGPVFAVDVDELDQLEDFSDLSALDGGKLAPFEEVRFTVNGVEKDLLDVIRDASGNGSLNRTDIRLNIGADGEFYILNKRDGILRRLEATAGIADGDANRDGTVDGQDFLMWQQNVGQSGDWSDGDFDGNKVVDSADLAIWQAGYDADLLSTISVPEPSSLALAAFSLLLAQRIRRK